MASRWLKPYTVSRTLGVANDILHGVSSVESFCLLTAWSRPVSTPCCTEHGQRCGTILVGRITTVAMSRSGQLGVCCTVEPNCSGMFAHLPGASVTRDRALDTCELSCVPGVARPFFIPVVHDPLRAMGYVAPPELSSRGGEVGTTW
jgi:hypothetical protein